jgi:Protein of unknown function (DUF3575)
MKKLILAITLVSTFVNLQAQTELKINPLGALFLSPDVSAEFGISESFGLEPTLGVSFFRLTLDGNQFKSTGASYGAQGKYYFSPKQGIDGFYGGVYVRGGHSNFKTSTTVGSGTGTTSSSTESFTRDRLGAGFTLGYKWITAKNVVIELGAGLGRKIFNKYSNAGQGVNTSNIPILNFDGFFKFSVGYRFGGGSSK